MAIDSEASEKAAAEAAKKPGFASVLVPVATILAVVLVAMGWIRGRSGTETGAPGHAGHSHRAIGSPIPDFDLESLDGKSKKLSDVPGKVVLINFWATWCGPCVQEMPSLQKLADEYGSRGVAVIGVNVDEQPEKVLEAFRTKHNIRFPTYVDPEGKVAGQFEISGLPLTLVVDSNRKLLHEQIGDEDWYSSTLRKQFDVWLAAADGKDPAR